MSPFTVALTGGIGSGKSTVASMFRGCGAGVIDTDAIARELTGPEQPAVAAIARQLGTQYIGVDGGLDRAATRNLVFGDSLARAKLEAVLHPLIRERVAQDLTACREPYVLIAIPLLVESGGYPGVTRRVLVVDCDERLQIARTMARSGLTEAQVRAIIATQSGRAERLERADDVITNNSDLASLLSQVAALDRLYRSLARGCA